MKALQKIAFAGILPTLILAILLFSNAFPGKADDMRPGTFPPPPLKEWVTYTNEHFGFRFQHPPDWYVDASSISADGNGSVRISTYSPLTTQFKGTVPENYFKMEISVLAGEPLAPGQTLDEWRSARIGYDSTKIQEEKHETVAGVDALMQKEEYRPGKVGIVIYVPYHHAVHGDFVIMMHTLLRAPIVEEVFWQIVETFELVK